MIQAKSIAVTHCGCGNVHIALYDDAGEEVVRASMSPIEAGAFLGDLSASIEAARRERVAKARPN